MVTISEDKVWFCAELLRDRFGCQWLERDELVLAMLCNKKMHSWCATLHKIVKRNYILNDTDDKACCNTVSVVAACEWVTAAVTVRCREKSPVRLALTVARVWIRSNLEWSFHTIKIFQTVAFNVAYLISLRRIWDKQLIRWRHYSTRLQAFTTNAQSCNEVKKKKRNSSLLVLLH